MKAQNKSKEGIMLSMPMPKCLFAIAALALLTSACASVTPKLDAERAKNVRKVAIVAFELQQKKATDNLGLGKLKSLKEGEDGSSKEMVTMATNVLNQFAGQLQKKTNWNVMPIKDMIANPEYKQTLSAKMSGLHAISTASDKMDSVYPVGVLNVAVFRQLSLEERAKLAKALGVDAVIELSIVNSMDQSMYSFGHLTGDADFALTARANVLVYGMQSEDPIWLQYVTGETTQKSDSLPESLSKREKMSRLGEEASQSAIRKLIDSYTL